MAVEDREIRVKLHADDHKMKKRGRNGVERVCHICSKVFSSGKALGGHMRIHIKFPPNKKSDAFLNTICGICGKNFPSMKSLFGHMRCHPDRSWRGMHPPKSCSSSWSVSDPSDINDDPSCVGAADLRAVLKGWPVTAKRGRKGMAVSSSSFISSLEEDDQLLNAGNYLMMLAQGNEIEIVQKSKKYNQSEEAIDMMDHGDGSRKTVADESVNVVEMDRESVNNKLKINQHSYSSGEDQALNSKDSMQMIKNKKKRKKRCLSRLLEGQEQITRNRVPCNFDLNELPQPEDDLGLDPEINLGSHNHASFNLSMS